MVAANLVAIMRKLRSNTHFFALPFVALVLWVAFIHFFFSSRHLSFITPPQLTPKFGVRSPNHSSLRRANPPPSKNTITHSSSGRTINLTSTITQPAKPVKATPPPAPVLIVVVSIGRNYSGFAAKSVRAYAQRHGYRLHVQRKWRGHLPPPKLKRALRTQKLLACSLARGEKYVLTLDSDVVIAPWSPPIHVYEQIGDNVGIVDEDQPTPKIHKDVERLRYGGGRWTNVTKYYSLFGDVFKPRHGVLNSGVVLVQPKLHCSWFHSIYYSKEAQTHFSRYRDHYDQPVLGVALLRRKRYHRMHHAWNRGWVFYKHAHRVSGRTYRLWDVWQRSFFMHMYWDKDDMRLLELEMKRRGVSFEPQKYPSYLID